MKSSFLLLSIVIALVIPTNAFAQSSPIDQLNSKYGWGVKNRPDLQLRRFDQYLNTSINSNPDTRQLARRAKWKFGNTKMLFDMAVNYCTAYKKTPSLAQSVVLDYQSDILNNPRIATNDALGIKYLLDHVFYIAEEMCF